MPTTGRGLRILLGADTFRPDVNGAVHFTERLARGLAARGHLLGFVPLPAGLAAALSRWAWKDFVRVFRQADIVTTPTPRAAQLLEDCGFPGSVDVVSCGIDIAHYAPRHAEDRSGAEVQVLFVGRLDAEKNVDDLTRALLQVPSVRANIVGDGSRKPHLQDLAQHLGVAERITFHGTVSDAGLVHAYRTNHFLHAGNCRVAEPRHHGGHGRGTPGGCGRCHGTRASGAPGP